MWSQRCDMKMFDAHWAHNEGKQQFKNSKKKSMAGRNPTFPIKLISVSKAIIQEPCVHVLLYQLFSVKLGMEDPIALLTLRTGTTYSAWQGESATKILHNGSHGRFQVILRESQAI